MLSVAEQTDSSQTMKQAKKETYITPIHISLRKFRYVYYKDRPLSQWVLSMNVKTNKITSEQIVELRSRKGLMQSPVGIYGAPCPTLAAARETVQFLVELGLKEYLLTITNRYRIVENQSIMPDAIPVPYRGVESYHRRNIKGFKTFNKAFVEAKTRFEQKCKWLRNDKTGKPLQPVSILIVDEQGNKLLKQDNGYNTNRKK